MDLFATVEEARSALRRGEVSAVALAEAALARIEKLQPTLRAMTTVTRDDALARAREADAELARDEDRGPLHGIPVTVKESFAIAGVRTTAGAPIFEGYVPAHDALAVQRLRRAGAVILGHTNVPTLLGDFQCINPLFGRTNNPWDVTRTPGGSSGGAAAAVAAGIGMLALGSDLGGSIRVPAAFCGVYGHKPTVGLVPLQGHVPPPPDAPPLLEPQLPAAGPLARSPRDLLLALEALGGPASPALRWSLPAPRALSPRGLRIGVVLDDPLGRVAPAVSSALQYEVDALAHEGARIVHGWPKGIDPARQLDVYRYLAAQFFARPMAPDDEKRLRARAQEQDGSYEAIEALAWTAPAHVTARMQAERTQAQLAWASFFESFDAFLCPAVATQAFPHDLPRAQDERTFLRAERGAQLFWSVFATLAGLPATVAPAGIPGRLPVGVQIIGPAWEDATPIAVAAMLAGEFVAPPV